MDTPQQQATLASLRREVDTLKVQVTSLENGQTELHGDLHKVELAMLEQTKILTQALTDLRQQVSALDPRSPKP